MILRVIDHDATSLKIKEMILKKGYSIREIQKMLCLESVQSVYAWISVNRRSIPDIEHFIQLSDILGCTILDMIVTRDVEVKPGNSTNS